MPKSPRGTDWIEPWVEEYADRLVQYVHTLTQDVEAARDIVQETPGTLLTMVQVDWGPKGLLNASGARRDTMVHLAYGSSGPPGPSASRSPRWRRLPPG